MGASVHEVDEDIAVSRERELGDDIVYSRETVMSRKRGVYAIGLTVSAFMARKKSQSCCILQVFRL